MLKAACALCGCSELQSLIFIPNQNLYFCNYKNEKPYSHIIQYLKEYMHRHPFPPLINPPKCCPVSNFQCFQCRNTCVWDLEIISDQQKLSIWCRNCRLQHKKEDFISLYSDGKLNSTLVPLPHKKPSTTDDELIANLKYLFNPPKYKNDLFSLSPAQEQYNNISEYSSMMLNFIEASDFQLFIKMKQVEKVIKWISRTSFQIRISGGKMTNGHYIDISEASEEIQGKDRGKVIQAFEDGRLLEIEFFSEPSFYGKNVQLCWQTERNTTTITRQIRALTKFAMFPNILVSLFLGQTENVSKLNPIIHSSDIKVKLCQNMMNISLNDDQTLAIKTALSNKVSIICGPPGTGKTTVISCLVNSALAMDYSKICICSQSNAAADVICCMLGEANLNPLRVYSPCFTADSSIHNKYNAKRYSITHFRSSIDERKIKKYRKTNQTDLINKLNAQNNSKEKIEIMKRNIICVTTSTAGCERFKKYCCDILIVDEASMALDPDIMIPLCFNPKIVVLVGDEKQLGPVVKNVSCVKNKYNISLFERLLKVGFPKVILKQQYRMLPILSTYPSNEFYENQLLNAPSINYESVLETPLVFCEVKSFEELDSNGCSFVNTTEANVILKWIEHLELKGIDLTDIGVISPYEGQTKYLFKIIDNQKRNLIEISSVDGFQGKEKDYIIFNLVRSNSSKIVGFLDDKRRMNVGLTRAKKGLIIVGNSMSFEKDERWVRLFEHIRQHGKWIKY
jgi:regulator of nonsense transcripts 1